MCGFNRRGQGVFRQKEISRKSQSAVCSQCVRHYCEIVRFAVLPALGINEKKPGISLFLRARILGFLFGCFFGGSEEKSLLISKILLFA